MSAMDTNIVVTNEQIAKDIGVTHSMVSRIRSGDRYPSYATMKQIERAYNWSVPDQLKARDEEKYAATLEYQVRLTYVR